MIFFLALYNAGHLILRAWGFRVGLEWGSQVGDSLRAVALPRQADRFAAVGVFLLGGLVGLALGQGWVGEDWPWFLLSGRRRNLGVLAGESGRAEGMEMDLLGNLNGDRVDLSGGVVRMSEIETKEALAQVVNRAGMHARPAALLVRLAGTFKSEIHVEKGGLQVNGKSIMGVLMLAAEQGSTLRFTASGPDSDEALIALTDLVRRGFEEE